MTVRCCRGACAIHCLGGLSEAQSIKMANLKWRAKCRLWNSFSIRREGECEHMSEKCHVGSVANQPFSFQRDYFPVHFVIHFRCITKPYSLSSFALPHRPKKFRTWRTLSRAEIKGKIKTKAAALRFFHDASPRTEWRRCLCRWHFTAKSVWHTAKHFSQRQFLCRADTGFYFLFFVQASIHTDIVSLTM